jgi:hypothetical protein
MDKKKKREILDKAKAWWRDELVIAHKENTLKLANLGEFNINPFLWSYLAHYLAGKNTPRALAEVLVLPRVLGTSITTSFGTRSQHMITEIFDSVVGSTTTGIDIEFVDQVDGRKRYCQLKSGPNIVNKDGVATVKSHFTKAINLARQNKVKVQPDDYVFCLLYGEPAEKSTFIKDIEKDHVVWMGKEFWYRLTGDKNFYNDLINAIGEVAIEQDMRKIVNGVVEDLAKEIKKQYPDLIE